MPQAARNIYVSAASADAGDAEPLHLRAEYHRIVHVTRRATRHLSRGIRHAIFLTRSDRTRLLSLTGHPNCRAISRFSNSTIGSSYHSFQWRSIQALSMSAVGA